MFSLVVLSGNPRTPSKTTALAVRLGELIATAVGSSVNADLIELADFGSAVLAPADDAVAAARESVASSRTLIVATPVYKGSYTGLLKAFLDGYGPTSLSGVAAIPFVVAGSPAHTAIAAEIHLRPLLHELGAHTPFGTLTMLEADIAAGEPDALLEAWVAKRADLFTAVASRSTEGVAA